MFRKFVDGVALVLAGGAILWIGWLISVEAIAAKQENRMLRERVLELESRLAADDDAPAPAVQCWKVKDNGSLAFRNRNLLNVKGKNWQGQVGNDKFGHAVFKSWEYGVRAAAFTLRTYAVKHKLTTLESIVGRFAEGNRLEYVAFLGSRMGLDADEEFDVIRRLPELLRNMARFESGQDLPEQLFVPYDILAKL